MRLFRRASLLALLLATAAIGAVPQPIPKSDAPAKAKDAAPGPVTPPLLTGPKTAKYLATFTVTGLAATDVVVWSVTPIVGVDVIETDCNQALSFAGPAGEYSVKATVVTGGKKLPLENTVTLTGAPIPPVPQPPGPGPTPPGPGPNPPGPTPPAPTAISRFVVAEDTTKAGPWRSEILGSSKVEAFYRQLRGNRAGPIHTLVDVTAGNADADSRRFVPMAAGKKLPVLFLLDATDQLIGKPVEGPFTPDSFIAAFDTHPEPRAMGLILEAPKLKWVEFGSTPQTPIIPRDQWKNRRLSAFLPPVYDQDGRGQCASSACCATIETVAAIQGLTYPKLAAGDLYGRVNGGRDSGSLLEDNLNEAMTNGVAPASMVPYVWDGKTTRSAAIVAERKKYKIAEAYLCPNFDAMVSAILQGFVVEHGLMWGNNFTPDKDGWLPAKATGRPGGHALCGYGVEIRADGTVGIVTRNSWSASWGMAGDCIIPESCFGTSISGYFAVRVVAPPEPKTRLDNPFNLREFALAW